MNNSEKLNSTYTRHYTGAKELKLYPFLSMLFIILQIAGDLFNFKFIAVNGIYIVPVGIIFYPFVYSINDIASEVYGYARARRMIWASIACICIFIFLTELSLKMNPAPGWIYQQEFEDIFRGYPRFGIAAIIAFFAGTFSNSFILSKTKIVTHGKNLLLRLILSSVVGILINSTVFTILSFIGTLSISMLLNLIVTSGIIKVMYDIVLIPFTIFLVRLIKNVEKLDVFDTHTKFNPFSLSIFPKENIGGGISQQLINPMVNVIHHWNQAIHSVDQNASLCFLATAENDVPSIRTMLIQDINLSGITLLTSKNGKKYQHILNNGNCEILLLWRSIGIQYRVSGRAIKLSEHEMLPIWNKQPYNLKILYWYQSIHNPQSAPLRNIDSYLEDINLLEERFPAYSNIEIPENVICFKLIPKKIDLLDIAPAGRYQTRQLFQLESQGWQFNYLVP
jgi:uncharacterized integral membrane protein (TIGR00697 family)